MKKEGLVELIVPRALPEFRAKVSALVRRDVFRQSAAGKWA